MSHVSKSAALWLYESGKIDCISCPLVLADIKERDKERDREICCV